MAFAPPARSCHVTKWPEFQGYGFTLHHNKSLGLQEIGKVDENSPAAAAGLKAQDIIIEINGINVTRENHKQIVERIKSSGDSTRFLVVDEQCKEYHDHHGNIISSEMPNIVHISSERGQAQQEASSESTGQAQSQPESRRMSTSSSESSGEDEGAVRKADGLATVQEGSERSSSDDDDGYAKSDEEEEKEDVTVQGTREVQDSVSSSSESSSESETEEAPAPRMASPEPTSRPQPPPQAAKPKITSFSEAIVMKETSDRKKIELVDGLSLNLSVKEMKKKIRAESKTNSWKRNDHRFSSEKVSWQQRIELFKGLRNAATN